MFTVIKRLGLVAIILLASGGYALAGPPPYCYEEQDGSPSGCFKKLKFPNGNVTDNGDGSFSIADNTSVGGGNSVYLEEGDVAKLNNSSADLTLDFNGTDFDTSVAGAELDLTIAAGVTRDTEWDTAAKINAATSDDDFATLTGSQVLTNKTLSAADNVIEADTGDSATGFFSAGVMDSARFNWDSVPAETIIRSKINWSTFWTDAASGINWGSIPGATTDYVLKRTATGVNWQASSGVAETNSLEVITTGIASTEIPIGTAADTVVYAALSGDVTMTNAGVVSIGNDKVVEADLKAVDAASDEDILTYESTTGDFEWHTISEMIALMTAGALPNDSILEADLKAVDAAVDEECLTYESTTGDFEWQSCGAGGSGATDLSLPIYSAKITGTFALDQDATQGAQIDAGDGNWRLLFDATTDEGAVWQFVMPSNYASTPTIDIDFSMTSGEANEVEFEGAIMCYTAGTDTADVATASFSAIAVGTATTVSATAGEVYRQSITLTDDSCAAGDMVWIYLSTDADDATNDDATGDREVIGVNFNYA